MEGDYNVITVDRLGPSLEVLLDRCNGRFSLRTVLLLADQLVRAPNKLSLFCGADQGIQISCIEYIHSRNFVHRDIKPSNLLMGTGKHVQQVYLIDFGLAKEYRDPKTRLHTLKRTSNGLVGTALYASINNHLHVEQSRRDDLESLAYVLIHFLLGTLPWKGLSRGGKVGNRNAILTKKFTIPANRLCRHIPDEFSTLLDYARRLDFDERPDYDYLRTLFQDLFIRLGYQQDDDENDWFAIPSPVVPRTSGKQRAVAESTRV
jgi:serine/threonine protein kinase